MRRNQLAVLLCLALLPMLGCTPPKSLPPVTQAEVCPALPPIPNVLKQPPRELTWWKYPAPISTPAP